MPFIGTQPAESALTTAHLNDDIVTSAKIVDGTIAAGDIASSAVTTAKINADAVTGAKIADDALDSEHYTDGSIDAAHIASNAVTTAKINADAVTGAKIADDALDSEHYTDGSIDTAHIAANAIDGTLTKDALIADYSDVTITASDLIMYGDATDSNNTKRDTVQGILDLAGGGAWSLISSTDISNAATFNFTAVDASSYDAYCVLLQHLIPATDNVDFHMTTSTNGGSSYDTGSSDYRWTQNATEDEVTTTQRHFDYDAASIQLTAAGTSIHCNVGSDSEEDGVSGFIYIIAPHVAKLTTINWSINYITATPGTPKQIGRVDGVAARNSQADVDAWSLYFASGNIESGTASVFGIKNS